MFAQVYLHIHHGGNFVRDHKIRYVNGDFEKIQVDPDYVSYPHLIKHIKKDRYSNIVDLYYKLCHEGMDQLRLLSDDYSTVGLIEEVSKWGEVEIYVEHGLDDASIHLELARVGASKAAGMEDEQHKCNLIDEVGAACDNICEDTPVVGNVHANNEDSEGRGGDVHVDPGDEDLEDADKDTEHTSQIGLQFRKTGRSEGGQDSENEDLSSDDVEDGSVYYDSEDPPSYVSENEQEDAGGIDKTNFPFYNTESDPPTLDVGMLFDDGNQFKNAMIRYAIHKKRNIRFVKNEPMRVRFKCETNCLFECSASWERSLGCFQIKTLVSKHRCNQRFHLRVVSQKWIQQKYEAKISDNPTIGHMELKKHIEDTLKINVSVWVVGRAIKEVLKSINAKFEDQFKRIRDYAQECLNSNPGSTVKILTERPTPESPCVFKRMYVCFGAMKAGFLEGCRKIIGLDGCFIKTALKGEILSAVGRDANNQMYPIAWAVVEIENTDSWRWFLTLLKNDLGIGNVGAWTFISDQQKGLLNAINELFPYAEVRNCARHIHANWSKGHRGKVMKKHFWVCARSTNEAQFKYNMEALGKVDRGAKDDLEKHSPSLWSKAFIRTEVKCDAIDNNLSEAFNSTLITARQKPIIPMLETIRVGVMRRIAKKRKSVKKWSGNHGCLIIKQLQKNILHSMGWHVDFNGDSGYEIKKGRMHFTVKLDKRICSCRSWDLTGIPCAHAVCAIFDKGMLPEDFIDECYSKEVYLRTYSHTLSPMNGEMLWPTTQTEDIHAPIPKKMSGRPKKKRVREVTEEATRKGGERLSRKGRIMTCSLCNVQGHSKVKCPTKATTQPTSTATKRRPRKRGPKESGFGVYSDPNTGATYLNPGQSSEVVIEATN